MGSYVTDDSIYNTKESMPLTSCLLDEINWQLWRREAVLGMKRIKAYGILTGEEKRPEEHRPAESTAPTTSDDDEELRALQAELSAATIRFATALSDHQSEQQERNNASQQNFIQAQMELEQATMAYQKGLFESTRPAKPSNKTAIWDQKHDNSDGRSTSWTTET